MISNVYYLQDFNIILVQIVVGLVNKNIEVYDRKSLHLVRLLAGHEDHVWSVDMNTEYVVSGSWDSRYISVGPGTAGIY